MLSLPTKFQDKLNSHNKTPVTLLKIRESELITEQTTQADWTANSSESGVDYSYTSGQVRLAEVVRYIDKIWLYGSTKNSSGNTTIQLYESDQSTPVGTSVTVVAPVTTDAWYSLDFSSQNIELSTATEYWIKVTGTIAGHPLFPTFNGVAFDTDTSSYVDGQLDYYAVSTTTWTYNAGDLTFKITFDSGSNEEQLTTDSAISVATAAPGPSSFSYVHMWQSIRLSGEQFQTNGNITTQTMDLGSVPTGNGFIFLTDSTPTNTDITYEAWYSDTGAFAGEETSIGTVTNGQSLTDLHRYWQVKANLSTTDTSVTPSLLAISIDFSVYQSYCDYPRLGYEASLKSVGSFSQTIDDFKASSIGQINADLTLTDGVSEWFANNPTRGKVVKILIGFDGADFAESDFINYFWGTISNGTIKDETLTLTIKDYQEKWEKSIPTKWESVSDDITWTNQHPIVVMLDLLQNPLYINSSDERIDIDSFNDIKTNLSGWEVTRTITGSPEACKKLLDELRVLTSTYFILRNDGRISLKKYDNTDTAIATISSATNALSLTVDLNFDSVINDITTYHDWDGDGSDESDFGEVTITLDATSDANYGYKQKVIKDKWTDVVETAQITTLNSNIINRYATPPMIFSVDTDATLMYIEIGDFVTLTTHRIPVSGGVALSSKTCQVVSRSLDFKGHTIKLKLLEVN